MTPTSNNAAADDIEAIVQPIHGVGALESCLLVFADLPPEMQGEVAEADPPFEASPFSAHWAGAQFDGRRCLCLTTAPSDAGPADSPPALWWFPDPPRALVAAATKQDSVVGLVSSQIFEPADLDADDPEKLARLLSSALYLEPRVSPQSIRHLLDSEQTASGAVSPLVEISADQNLKQLLRPVMSRVARVRGEIVSDNQLLPMRWRPWHYDVADRKKGIEWNWPVIQVAFDLSAPASWNFSTIAAPQEDAVPLLRRYLQGAERLARSMSLNSEASLSIKFTAEEGLKPAETTGPPSDAFDALFANLRKLHDPNEGSGFSFLQVRNLLSNAANASGNDELVAELRRWKRGHDTLKRASLHDIRTELAEEGGLEDASENLPVGTANLGKLFPSDFSLQPQLPPSDLIATYMYGEVVHEDAAKATTIEQWDGHPIYGAIQRQAAIEAAHSFVHFYGAFAGYVEAWLRECVDSPDAS